MLYSKNPVIMSRRSQFYLIFIFTRERGERKVRLVKVSSGKLKGISGRERVKILRIASIFHRPGL
jgi:hypothetical protein